jgi:prepilin-type N-terminal cleavage/methylation domain-containing protein
MKYSRGLTLIEVVVSSAILSMLVLMLLSSMRSQADALALAGDQMNTTARASSALRAIREELRGMVLNPSGVDGFEVAQDHVQFRPVVGFLPSSDPAFTAMSELEAPNRRLSKNQILYEANVKRIAYVPSQRRITVTQGGFTRVLAEGVDEFTFFNADSLQALPDFTPPSRTPLVGTLTVLPAAPPSGVALLPDVNTFDLGIRLVIGARAQARASVGKRVRQWSYSNVLPDKAGATEGACLAGGVMTTSIMVVPETITNTRSKPTTQP